MKFLNALVKFLMKVAFFLLDYLDFILCWYTTRYLHKSTGLPWHRLHGLKKKKCNILSNGALRSTVMSTSVKCCEMYACGKIDIELQKDFLN